MACGPGCLVRKPQQQLTAAKSSTAFYVGCVRGALRTLRTSVGGRQAGRVRVASLVCGRCAFLGRKSRAQTPKRCLSGAQQQFERPASPSDKPIAGTNGWCHRRSCCLCHIRSTAEINVIFFVLRCRAVSVIMRPKKDRFGRV